MIISVCIWVMLTGEFPASSFIWVSDIVAVGGAGAAASWLVVYLHAPCQTESVGMPAGVRRIDR